MKYSNKLAKSAFFGQFPILMQLVSGFVVMPRLVEYFGSRHYGLWVLIGTFLGYFGLLDSGFSKTIVRYVSRALGKGDKEESDGWITLGLFLFVIAGLLGFVILLAGIWSCGFFISTDLELIRKVLLISGGALLISFPSRCAVGVLQAHVRGDILDLIISGCSSLRIVALLTGLAFNISFVSFVFILAAFTLVEGSCLLLAANTVHSGFKLNKEWITHKNFKLFLDYSGFSFIAQLADLIRFQAYPIIISSFLGLSAVTTFAIANRIRTILGQVFNKVLTNLTPVFSQIEGRSEGAHELKQAYLFSYKISCHFVLFVGGMTAIVAPDFIERWMGPEHQDSIPLLLISLIGLLAAGCQIPAICFLFGTSRHRFYAISNSLEAALILITSIILVRPFGLIGILWGASISTCMIKMFLQPLWVTRALNMGFWRFHFVHTLSNILKAGAFIIVVAFIATPMLSPNYWRIVIVTGVAGLLYVPYIFYVGYTKRERLRLFELIPTSHIVKMGLGWWGR